MVDITISTAKGMMPAGYHLLTPTEQQRLRDEIQTQDLTKPLSLQDYLPAFELTTLDLPARTGRYNAEFSVPLHSEGEYFDGEGFISPGLLTLTCDYPEWLADIPTLRGEAVFKVHYHAKETRFSGDFFEEGRVRDFVQPAYNHADWYVEAAVLRARLWKEYGVNLACLEAIRQFMRADCWSRATWGILAPKLRIQAFALHRTQAVAPVNHGPATINTCELQPYFRLDQAVDIIALLDLYKANNIKLELPNQTCALLRSEGTETKIEVVYFDPISLKPSSPIPYAPTGQETRSINTKLKAVNQAQASIQDIEERFNQLLIASLGDDNGFDAPLYKNPTPFPAASHSVRQTVLTLATQRYDYQQDIISHYKALVAWAAHPDRRSLALGKLKTVINLQITVVQAEEELKQRKPSFVKLPNNMEGLPAHFALIPEGIGNGMQLIQNDVGQDIVQITRSLLQVEAGSNPRGQQNDVSILLPAEYESSEKSTRIGQIDLLLGDEGKRWVIPQGIVALSKLYFGKVGYAQANKVCRIYLTEWVHTMRPTQVDKFKNKGIGAAFGGKHHPRELFDALLGILQGITYKHTENPRHWSELRGFYITTYRGEDARGYYVDIQLNPSLHDFVTGKDNLPYMVSNTQAMFSYTKKALHYGPAAQWGLEQLARNNLFKKNDTGILATPQGDGFTRRKYADRFGLLRGTYDTPAKLRKRFDKILDNLIEVGIIKNVTLDGREKQGLEAFDVKLFIEMDDAYRIAYNLSSYKHNLEAAEKALKRPFSDSKQTPTKVKTKK